MKKTCMFVCIVSTLVCAQIVNAVRSQIPDLLRCAMKLKNKPSGRLPEAPRTLPTNRDFRCFFCPFIANSVEDLGTHVQCHPDMTSRQAERTLKYPGGKTMTLQYKNGTITIIEEY